MVTEAGAVGNSLHTMLGKVYRMCVYSHCYLEKEAAKSKFRDLQILKINGWL